MSKTVKVRVSVAVGTNGAWRIPYTSAELREGERLFWLTAELPIPEYPLPTDVPADVEGAD